MKVLVKIGVLLLMLALLFAAFVLPKFVQRTEPPMPEEDLAAALAAVELDESDAATTEIEGVEEDNPLREEKQFAAFFAALDEEDFEASSEELVKLSADLEPEVVDQLTAEMENAVTSMGSEESVAEVVMLETTEAPVEEVAPPSLADEPTATVADTTAPAPEATDSTTPPSVDPSAVVAFFALVQSGDFETASTELERLEKSADAATASSMKAALSSAKAREKALAASRKELEKSQQEMARLQKESVDQLKESVAQLTEVTKAAQKATEEASRLKTELATVEAEVEKAAAEPEKKPAKPIKLPAKQSIAFGFDSTFLNDASKDLLTSQIIGELKKEKRLTVQLRGHADAAGPSDYNGILAQARCEVVKDFLLEQGIASSRISIVSFGETQAAATGGTPEELRRVDVIFRGE